MTSKMRWRTKPRIRNFKTPHNKEVQHCRNEIVPYLLSKQKQNLWIEALEMEACKLVQKIMKFAVLEIGAVVKERDIWLEGCKLEENG